MTDVVRAAPLRRRAVRRAVVLAGLGAGFWLLGQAGASADEAASGLTAALTDEVRAPVVSTTSEIVSAVSSTVAEPVAPAAVPEPPVAATPPPVAAAPPAAQDAPVPGALRPVRQAVDLVRDVSAPVREVAKPIVSAPIPVVSDLVDVADETAPPVEVVDREPVLDLVRDVLGGGPGSLVEDVPSTDMPAVGAPAVSRSDAPLEASGVRTPDAVPPLTVKAAPTTSDQPSANGAVALGSEPLRSPADRSERNAPAPVSGTPAEAPSRTSCIGWSSLDHPAADLAVLAALRGPGTCLTAAGAGGAVGGLPLDPSFSPD